ncbi:MAG: DUF5596 domain-containing protein [Lentisphaerae bacterium]|nr:DUF5596 domain-containing protein [Lentisphaerota bacterium]
MNLTAVFAALGLDTACLPAVSANWERSVASLPSALPGFLEPGFCAAHYPLVQGPPAAFGPLCEVAARLAADPAGRLLAWHAHRTLCEYDREKSRFREWPDLDAFLGPDAGLFYLLIALSGIPDWLRACRDAGIPEQYGRDCAPWLGGAMGIYAGANGGRYGLNRRQLYWTAWYMTGKLFRLGRFEYMSQEIGSTYPTVYRERTSGRVVALCNSGWLLDREGFCLYADQPPEEAHRVTELADDGTVVTGTPIAPWGQALPEITARLPRREWERVLGPGDFAPGVHIPSGGGMTLLAAADSLRRAEAFYRQYLPAQPVKAFVCASWIFNTQLEEVLPESNLSIFMRQLYLTPWRSSGRDGLFFIFGREDGDRSQYPRDTSIRRALLQILDSGRRLRVGGMVLLPGHLPHLGEEYYRRQWSPPPV